MRTLMSGHRVRCHHADPADRSRVTDHDETYADEMKAAVKTASSSHDEAQKGGEA